MIHNYTYRYNNIILKALSQSEIENLRIWRNEKKNCRYLSAIPYISKEMQQKWFEKYKSNNDEMCFSIYETVELNRMVGSLSLYNFHDDQAEFGKILIGDNAAHGKGVGYSALNAALKIAFDDLNLSNVILHVYSENKPALYIYQKAGFNIIDSHENNGMDEYTMMLSKSEFENRMEDWNA